jgi:hypothetical protein
MEVFNIFRKTYTDISFRCILIVEAVFIRKLYSVRCFIRVFERFSGKRISNFTSLL